VGGRICGRVEAVVGIECFGEVSGSLRSRGGAANAKTSVDLAAWALGPPQQSSLPEALTSVHHCGTAPRERHYTTLMTA
jgi:hypothetical protein